MKKINKNTLIRNCGFSVRAQNVLYLNSEKMGVPCTTSNISPLKLGDLSKISIADLKSFRQCGDKTVVEITVLAESAGVKFKS